MSESPPGRVITVRRRNLPHWETEEGTYFVTFRLADSLPIDVARRIASRKRFHLLADRFLDRGWGARYLRDPRCARIMESALRFFDGQRYRLHAYVVMPNHVHLSFKTFPGFSVSSVVHSWKGYSGKQINATIGRSGPLWQTEPYDSLIHDANDLRRTVEYIVRNPIKAKLVDWPWVGVLDTNFKFRES